MCITTVQCLPYGGSESSGLLEDNVCIAVILVDLYNVIVCKCLSYSVPHNTAYCYFLMFYLWILAVESVSFWSFGTPLLYCKTILTTVSSVM